MKLHLTLACGDYDLMRALRDEIVRPEGIELTVVNLTSPERHWRMVRHQEFDVCEYSMGSYMLAHDLGQAPFTAIPVFPHRRMRHSFFLINPDAGVTKPKDLEGKRVGLRELQNSAAIWMRGILQDEYGVDLSSITWVVQDEEDVPMQAPSWMKVDYIPRGETLDTQLQRGELACAMYPDLLPTFAKGTSAIRRLFADPKAEEISYYQRTGLFPIMHTVVIRKDILERYPWVAKSMYKAFDQAKAEMWKNMMDPRKVSLMWFQPALEEQKQIAGPDPWAYGLEVNRKALETMLRYGRQLGLVNRADTSIEEWFCPSTLDATPDLLH